MRVDAVVVGAGLTGLVCAVRLQRAGRRVALLEASSRTGGNVWTARDDGAVRELGPNAFGDGSAPLVRLVDELGLTDRVVRAPDFAGRRFLFTRGRLRRVPSNPVAFLASGVLPLAGRLRLAREPFVGRRPDDAPEETLAQFCDRRLGVAARRGLVTPVVSGITAGDPERLGVAAAFPRLVAMERDHGSLLRGALRGPRPPSRGRLATFDDGLSVLTDALTAALGSAVRCGARVHALTRRDAAWHVDAETPLVADDVVLALPPHATAAVLRPLSDDAARALDAIDAPPLAVVHATLPRSPALPDAFGFLAPRESGLRILGAIFGSRLFPGRAPAGADVLTVFVGGALDREATDLDDGALCRIVADDLARALPSAPVAACRVHRWSKSIPQYHVGHAARIARVDAALATLPGLHAVGAWRDGIALPDRVVAGDAVARAVLERRTS